MQGERSDQLMGGLIQPVDTASRAISIASGYLPSDVVTRTAIARLVDMGTVTRLSGWTSGAYPPHVLVWWVALLADAIEMNDIFNLPGLETSETEAPVGAYYVVDASSGGLAMVGALKSKDEYVAIEALENLPVAISSATPWDVDVPTTTPSKTPSPEVP